MEISLMNVTAIVIVLGLVVILQTLIQTLAAFQLYRRQETHPRNSDGNVTMIKLRSLFGTLVFVSSSRPTTSHAANNGVEAHDFSQIDRFIADE
jgi:hypothetical protein